jgi:acyl carrier protein
LRNVNKWFQENIDRVTQSALYKTDSTEAEECHSAAGIQRWLQVRIGDALKVAGETVDPTQPINSYGLDSIAGFTLTLELAEWLERDLPASLLWEYPTILELAQFLSEDQ